jgi:hypothetical protein
MPNLFKALPRNRSTFALTGALAASSALATQDSPTGLFVSGGGQAGARPVRSASSRRADVAAR